MSASGFVWGQVPDNYKPNVEIQAKYDKIINELFVDIQAKSQVWQPISTTVFSELNTLFSDIIPFLPNKYSFNIIYQQCLTLSQTLAGWYNFNTLASFMDNCFKPFVKTVEEINKSYTIKPSWSITPISWPAPLTVTLDARASTDPSNQTIPWENFFRYYRDISGVDKIIGMGNVLNYTFNEAGNYRVHLTVRSSNRATQGILDGSSIFSVDVSPKSANIVAYANGQKLEPKQKAKLWLQEWQRGIVLDGSATTAIGGRTILTHRREITWPNGFSATRQGEGIPSSLRVVLSEQWEYKIKLIVQDNQNNTLSETFSLAISDPVALIKQLPEVGNTSSKYSFDWSTSYSITSRLRLLTREIFDSAGNKTDTLQGKSINKQFSRPWPYTVKLSVIDEQWQENSEVRQILVESTPPVAQFISTPTADLLYPSEYVFDASVSSDIDEENGFDTLTYNREFSSPQTQIVESMEGGKKIRVVFDEIGKSTVKLTVIDQYGKSNEIIKEFDIKSTLRPKMFISPKATARGNQVTFVWQTNKDVLGYEWDFGDGNKRSVQERNTSHIYQSIWVYTVKLRVSNWADENEVKSLVFIGEKDRPIPWYSVEDPTSSITILQNDTCPNDDGLDIPAYRIARYRDIVINATDSVNVKGEKTDLKMFFQPRNDQIYKDLGGRFPYKFNEIGCQYVQLTVEDASAGKTSAVKVRFKIVNALPSLDNVTLSYPQFWNETGIGFDQQGVPQDIFVADYDPLMVKVSAINPKDNDWSISYFQWYYYYKDDPTRILATKLSPGNIPHTFFSLPKTPGEFAFWVKIYDNDWGSQRSEDIIGNGPVVFFPPDTNRPDIPIVTLKVDKTSVEVGEEITFDVISRVLSDRADFVQERVIQYDFDGDGEYDLTSKSDRVSYIYTKPSDEWIIPRASVVYRWYRWVAKWENVIIKNGLRPRLLFTSADTTTLVRDLSIGEIEWQKICMDARYCEDEKYVRTDRDEWFVFNYPWYDKYVVAMDVYDKNANNVSKRWPIETTPDASTMKMLSIPESSSLNQIPEIFVWKNLDNSVLFYIKYSNNNGVCYVDANIAQDSNKDDNPEQDKDFACNQIHLEKYTPSYQNATGRVYFESWGVLATQDFIVSFLDFELELSEKNKTIYDLINKVLWSLQTQVWSNQYLADQLVALKESIIDKIDAKAIVVAIQDTVSTQDVILSSNEKEAIDQIIELLQDKATSAALWWSIYDQAKAEILQILPQNLSNDIKILFNDFENAGPTTEQTIQEVQKGMLQNIIDTISKSVAESSANIQENQIDPIDMQAIIIPNVCAITNFYNIPSESCVSDNLKPVPTEVTTEVWWSGWFATRVKVLFIVLAILIAWFIWLVVLFAIKAKVRWQEEDEEEEENYIVPTEQTPPATSTPTTQTNETAPEKPAE